jgi:hypothetical protein
VAAFAVDTATVAMSTTYAKVGTLNGTDEDAAIDVPTRSVLGVATLQLRAVAGGATTVTWYISEDSAGDHPIAGPIDSELVGQTSAGADVRKGVAASLDVPWVTNEVPGSLCIWAKLDAGTANCTKAKLSLRTPG